MRRCVRQKAKAVWWRKSREKVEGRKEKEGDVAMTREVARCRASRATAARWEKRKRGEKGREKGTVSEGSGGRNEREGERTDVKRETRRERSDARRNKPEKEGSGVEVNEPTGKVCP